MMDAAAAVFVPDDAAAADIACVTQCGDQCILRDYQQGAVQVATTRFSVSKTQPSAFECKCEGACPTWEGGQGELWAVSVARARSLPAMGHIWRHHGRLPGGGPGYVETCCCCANGGGSRRRRRHICRVVWRMRPRIDANELDWLLVYTGDWLPCASHAMCRWIVAQMTECNKWLNAYPECSPVSALMVLPDLPPPGAVAEVQHRSRRRRRITGDDAVTTVVECSEYASVLCPNKRCRECHPVERLSDTESSLVFGECDDLCIMSDNFDVDNGRPTSHSDSEWERLMLRQYLDSGSDWESRPCEQKVEGWDHEYCNYSDFSFDAYQAAGYDMYHGLVCWCGGVEHKGRPRCELLARRFKEMFKAAKWAGTCADFVDTMVRTKATPLCDYYEDVMYAIADDHSPTIFNNYCVCDNPGCAHRQQT